MGKGKLAKFAEMATFPNVFQAPATDLIWRETMLGTSPQTDEPQTDTTDAAQVPPRGHWNEVFFHNDNPIVLELGCGRGEYTVGLARLFPDKNFIGVDIKGARMWHGARTALAENLTNAAFLRTNIEFIDRFFAPGEVSEIWLTFSDPQMKKPTKRLTATNFLERYRRFLVDNGTIHVKTDSNFLFTYTKYLIAENHLPVDYQTEDLYHTELSDEDRSILGIQTYYEQQWLNRGITIKYIKFHLPQTCPLTEPDVEIEMDSYRSYNRDKRSGSTTSK